MPLPVEEYLVSFKLLAIVNESSCYEHLYVSIFMKIILFSFGSTTLHGMSGSSGLTLRKVQTLPQIGRSIFIPCPYMRVVTFSSLPLTCIPLIRTHVITLDPLG